MPLLNRPDLHWLWIRLLVGCRSGKVALLFLRLLGVCRWVLFGKERRLISKRYDQLADLARDAGFRGPLTETPPAQLTRRYYISRAILGAAPAIVASASPSFLSTFVTCHNLGALRAEATREKGMVIAGTHFGSLGITPALLASRGLKVMILRDQSFAKLLNSRHGQQFFLGAEPLFLDSDNPESVNQALLKCSRALRQGAIVAYTADAQHGNRHEKESIFGREVTIRTALVELAARGGSAVLYGFSYFAGQQVQVLLSDPVQITGRPDLETWCRCFCRDWEQLILNYPEAISWHQSDLNLFTSTDGSN